MGNPLDEAAGKIARENFGEMPNARAEIVLRSRFMDLISMAAKKDAILRPMMEKWARMNVVDRGKYTIDDLASSCEIEASKVISAASGAAYEMGFGAGSLIAMTSFPQVVEKTIESANILGKEGAKDRELLMRHARFVPVPEGSTINIQNIATNRNYSSLESFEDAMKRFGTPAEDEAIEAECTPSE